MLNLELQYFGHLIQNADSLEKSLMLGKTESSRKRRLLLGRKVMTSLDSILKSRDIILPTKLCLFKVIVFPVVMYGHESWTIKKAEH